MKNQKELFDRISKACSKNITITYSTSFSFSIKLLNKNLQEDIYGIYGYVRLGDEIVDTFHSYNKKDLIKQFRNETIYALENKISLNPILNNFQYVINKYNIPWILIDEFIQSMEFDLKKKEYDETQYKKYIKGSAENVGLMCLYVFCNNNIKLYNELEPHAISLGSAFQKINFLRDLNHDHLLLGRIYFPGVNISEFNNKDKKNIEIDISKDFNHGLEGIKRLPKSSQRGVYIAYIYYWHLFKKIKTIEASKILKERIRISNVKKIFLILRSYIDLFTNRLK